MDQGFLSPHYRDSSRSTVACLRSALEAVAVSPEPLPHLPSTEVPSTALRRSSTQTPHIELRTSYRTLPPDPSPPETKTVLAPRKYMPCTGAAKSEPSGRLLTPPEGPLLAESAWKFSIFLKVNYSPKSTDGPATFIPRHQATLEISQNRVGEEGAWQGH